MDPLYEISAAGAGAGAAPSQRSISSCAQVPVAAGGFGMGFGMGLGMGFGIGFGVGFSIGIGQRSISSAAHHLTYTSSHRSISSDAQVPCAVAEPCTRPAIKIKATMC